MARVYQIQRDSRYNKAPVVQNNALVYLAYPNGNLSIRAKLHDGSVVTLASPQGSGTPSDSSNYYTKTQVDSFISQLSDSLQTKMHLPSNEGTAGQILRRTVQGWIWDNAGSTSTDLSDYYTKAQTQQLLDQLSDSIRSTVYTKVQTDTLISSLSDSLHENYYDKAQVDALIGQGPDFSNYYTKDQVNGIVSELSDSLHQNYYTKVQINNLIGSSSPYQTFDTVLQNKVYFQASRVPIGVKTNNDNYYPVIVGSVEVSDQFTSLNVTPYLTEDSQSEFQGTWTVYFSQGYNEQITINQFNNYYVASELPSSDSLSQYPNGSFFIVE